MAFTSIPSPPAIFPVIIRNGSLFGRRLPSPSDVTVRQAGRAAVKSSGASREEKWKEYWPRRTNLRGRCQIRPTRFRIKRAARRWGSSASAGYRGLNNNLGVRASSRGCVALRDDADAIDISPQTDI